MSFLTAGGPLIWLVLILGAIALVAAGRAFAQGGRQVPLAIGAAVATLTMALLNTVLGFQKSVSGLGQVAADKRWIYLVELEESLNNMVVALLVALLVSLLLAAGAYRRGGLGAAH